MERKYNIDFLRIISAIAVVIIHAIASPVTYSTVEVDPLLANNLELVHALMNWAVPVFYMITGYCLLRKQDCSYHYCFSHAGKYIGVLFTVGLFYALLEEVFTAKSLNFVIFVQAVKSVISGNLWDHMWFVYAIIGVYLVMPVIHTFLQQKNQNGYILTALLFLFGILFPTIKNWISIKALLPFSGHLFYVCFGGMVAKHRTSSKWTYIIPCAGLLALPWIVFGTNSHEFSYQHLAVCLMAMSIFWTVTRINIKPHKWIHFLSKCTWGVYLLHPFFINVAIKLLKIQILTTMPYVNLCLFVICLLCLSVLSTYVLRKIPLVKKLF